MAPSANLLMESMTFVLWFDIESIKQKNAKTLIEMESVRMVQDAGLFMKIILPK